MKKVSVIMSTYKTETNILTESIESILNQTYKNIEFVIICDGDKEEYEYIKSINDNRIKVILNDTNKGLPYSLNLAIKNSTGDYIARMDSDDIAIKDRLEKQVDFLERNKDIGLCGTEALLFGTKKGKKRVFLKNSKEVKVQLLYKATLIHPTVMARREVYEKFQYNEQFVCAQDFELWSRVSEEYNIVVLPIIGLKYRMHEKQASTEKKEKQAQLAMITIKSNSMKITGEYDERICKVLYVLGGRENLTRENCNQINDDINYLIKNNKKYDKKILKKVIYNRFFELLFKNKILTFKFDIIRKCLKIYNLRDVLEVIKYAR